MIELLVATVPLSGHVQPMLPVVRAAVARGHRVRWCSAPKFAAAIEATGATFAESSAARVQERVEAEAALTALRGRQGLSRVKTQLQAMFIEPMPVQLGELEALAGARAPDVIVSDSAHLGAALASEKLGVPRASVGIGPLMLPSADTAPFGSGLSPGRTTYHRLRNRFLSWAVLRVAFADINRSYRRARAAAGLTPGTGAYFDVLSPDLHLQPTIPSFEYPRKYLPPQIEFIGPLTSVPETPPLHSLPSWWGDVEAAYEQGTPIVLVTQGTLATDARELIAPALRGLARERVLVVVTTRADLPSLGLATSPAHVRIAPYIPYEALMPRLSLMVTNGGYHGVQMALAHGVPLVVAGGSEEKPETAARVAWSGVGRDLRTGRPSARAVRAAVRDVLHDERFTRRARELAREAARYGGAAKAAELIEVIAARRRVTHAPDR
jgi:MGT family glycosyltransferase